MWFRLYWNLPLSPSIMMNLSLIDYLCSDWLLFISALIITSTKNDFVRIFAILFLDNLMRLCINKSRNSYISQILLGSESINSDYDINILSVTSQSVLCWIKQFQLFTIGVETYYQVKSSVVWLCIFSYP